MAILGGIIGPLLDSSVLAVGSHFSFGGLWRSLWSPLQEILTLLEIDVPEREPDPVANHWPLDQGLLVAGVVTLVRVAAVLGTHYPTRRPRQAHTLV